MPRRGFGELEARVMRILWEAEQPLTSREVWMSFDDEDRPARTTLLTILSRLEDKELLVREAHAGGALFRPAEDEAQHAASSMAGMLDQVSNREAALAYFAGNLTDDDLASLRKAFGTP